MGPTDKTKAMLSFGSPEELRALGELTIQFSMVDYVLDQVAAQLGALIARGGEPLTSYLRERVHNLRFSDKVELLKKAIETFAALFPVSADESKAELLRLLGTLPDMARQRNHLIHGSLSWDTQNDRPIFLNKRESRDARSPAVEQLNAQLSSFVSDFYRQFLAWCESLRKASTPDKTSF